MTSFGKKLTGQTRRSGAMITLDGVKIAADILDCFSHQQGKQMINALQAQDLPLAEKIQSQLFVFDDFVSVDDRSMQILITKIPRETLTLALRGISGACLQKFLTNVSGNAAAMLKEALANSPARALSEIEKARKTVIDLARQLGEAEQINLVNDGLYI